jgi:uncharacterized protein (TIGR00304 family)
VRAPQLLGPAILVGGLLTLALAVMRGDASLYLVVIVPVVVGTGPLALLGILFVFAGFFLTFFLWNAGTPLPLVAPMEVPETPAADVAEHVPPKRRWGGVVFLGPIPLVFGSDPQMTRLMLVLGGILFLALLALTIAFLLA